jgi:hypothetical protein
VLAKHAELKKKEITNVELPLRRLSKQQFYNVSKLDFEKLLGDQDNIADQLRAYIAGFDPDARDIVEKFKFDEQITRLDNAGLLFLLIKRFCEVDLHPEVVDNVASLDEQLVEIGGLVLFALAANEHRLKVLNNGSSAFHALDLELEPRKMVTLEISRQIRRRERHLSRCDFSHARTKRCQSVEKRVRPRGV